MDSKDEIRKELSELSQKLEIIEKKNPFSVPDYYFQSLPDKIIEKVKDSSKLGWIDGLESALNQFFLTLFQPRYAIPAAAFLLALVVGINFFRSVKNIDSDTVQPLSEISSEEINEYVIENFDDEDLIAFNSIEENGDDRLLNVIPKEELENFIENNSDNQTIEEEIL